MSRTSSRSRPPAEDFLADRQQHATDGREDDVDGFLNERDGATLRALLARSSAARLHYFLDDIAHFHAKCSAVLHASWRTRPKMSISFPLRLTAAVAADGQAMPPRMMGQNTADAAPHSFLRHDALTFRT